MKSIKLLIVLMAAFVMTGCSTYAGLSKLRDHAALEDYNPQNFQGCTVGQYQMPDIQDESSGGLVPGSTVTWWDCKDKAHVAGHLDLNGDGKPDFSYTASDVVGSTAAKIRNDLEKAFAEAGVKDAKTAAEIAIKAMGL